MAGGDQDQPSTATISAWGAWDIPVRGSQWAGRGLLYAVTRWRPLLSTTPTSDTSPDETSEVALSKKAMCVS